MDAGRCSICGKPVEQRRTGRPRSTCGEVCARALRTRQRRLSRLADRDPEGRELVDALGDLTLEVESLVDALREQRDTVKRLRAELVVLAGRAERRRRGGALVSSA